MKTITYNNREYRIDAYNSNIEVFLLRDEKKDLEGGRVLNITVSGDEPAYPNDDYNEDEIMTSGYELASHLEEDTIIPYIMGEYLLTKEEAEEKLLQHL